MDKESLEKSLESAVKVAKTMDNKEQEEDKEIKDKDDGEKDKEINEEGENGNKEEEKEGKKSPVVVEEVAFKVRQNHTLIHRQVVEELCWQYWRCSGLAA